MSTLETTQATITKNEDGSLDIVTVGGTDPHLSEDEVADLKKLLGAKKAAKDDD